MDQAGWGGAGMDRCGTSGAEHTNWHEFPNQGSYPSLAVLFDEMLPESILHLLIILYGRTFKGEGNPSTIEGHSLSFSEKEAIFLAVSVMRQESKKMVD